MAITKLVRRVSKAIYLIILLVSVGHILPPPESYIDYALARRLALFVSGNENAESMYDAYSSIDWIVMLIIITPIYMLTIKLIEKIRSA